MILNKRPVGPCAAMPVGRALFRMGIGTLAHGRLDSHQGPFVMRQEAGPHQVFARVVHALFTDTFWSACNDDGNAPIYIEHDGRLFILDCAYGDQYYNSNIPDEFTLTAQTDDRIDFTVTAHYSYPYPRRDETEAERDERLETSYEYTRTYPVTLIYTDAGWRFDAFATPNQADMQLLGEWDGIEEIDFYGNASSP